MTLTATLSPLQQVSIRDATARANLWEGSVSSGKTIASLVAWMHYVAAEAPAGRLPMIGRTTDTLYRNCLAPMMDMLPAGDRSVRYTRGANVATVFGREVDVLGANDARSESRLRGMTAAGAYVDEFTLLPDAGYYSQLMNRLRVPGARLFATMNPDGPQHWAKVQVIDRADQLGYNVWHFTLDDNPALPPEYVAAIKQENVGLWYQRNVLGLWVLAEGTIWSMYDPDRHVIGTAAVDGSSWEGWTLAVDYGTAGTFAAELLAVQDDRRIVVVDEYRHDAKAEQRQLTDAEYSAELRTWLHDVRDRIGWHDPLERTVVDPSASSFIEQLHRDGWPHVRLADNAVADGLRDVATLLGADLVVISRHAPGLLDEIPGYVWDSKKAARGEDAPLKTADHSCDAFRYGIRSMRRYWRRWLERPAVPAA